MAYMPPKPIGERRSEMWERIDENTWRANVPGGWIVKSVYHTIYSGVSVSVHQIFIADTSHLWTIESMKEETKK